MADTQHTAENQADGLAIGVLDPNDPKWPAVREWQIWLGPTGEDPVASDLATLLGHGDTRDAAFHMAIRRSRRLVSDLIARVHA